MLAILSWFLMSAISPKYSPGWCLFSSFEGRGCPSLSRPPSRTDIAVPSMMTQNLSPGRPWKMMRKMRGWSSRRMQVEYSSVRREIQPFRFATTQYNMIILLIHYQMILLHTLNRGQRVQLVLSTFARINFILFSIFIDLVTCLLTVAPGLNVSILTASAILRMSA